MVAVRGGRRGGGSEKEEKGGEGGEMHCVIGLEEGAAGRRLKLGWEVVIGDETLGFVRGS